MIKLLMFCFFETLTVNVPTKSIAFQRNLSASNNMVAKWILNHQKIYNTPLDLYQIRTFIIPAKLEKPFDTKMIIHENEYLYIEVFNEVKIGPIAGNVNATGTSKLLLKYYSKNQLFNHGALIYKIGSQEGVCKELFNDEVTNPFYTYMARNARASIKSNGAVPGAYFLVSSGGNLIFDLNDKKTSDNTGQFKVRVFAINKDAHLKRNVFNICPTQENLVQNLAWEKEWQIFSLYYHGINNHSYRGALLKNAGCQCVYDEDTETLATDSNKGSFDIGNWLYLKHLAQNDDKNFLHLILDIIPHDLYTEKFGQLEYIGNQ